LNQIFTLIDAVAWLAHNLNEPVRRGYKEIGLTGFAGTALNRKSPPAQCAEGLF
jgi:hypothetical protein